MGVQITFPGAIADVNINEYWTKLLVIVPNSAKERSRVYF